MSLLGDCSDCGTAAQLTYKPNLPLDEQTRPTICPECAHRRDNCEPPEFKL